MFPSSKRQVQVSACYRRQDANTEQSEAATNFELFFDLWFVANLNVFTSVSMASCLDAMVTVLIVSGS